LGHSSVGKGSPISIGGSGHPLRWYEVAVALALVLLALVPRLQQLDAFVTPDEEKWVCRSVNFYRGLQSGVFQETLQTGHPGVITMWLGVPFMAASPEQEWLDVCRVPSLSDIIEMTPRGTAGALAALLFNARRGVAIITALGIGLGYLLLVRLFGRPMGLAGAVLIATDPFYLAHSRLLHLDAIATTFLFLAVLSLAIGLREDRRPFLGLSGVFGAMAMLNKSPSLFLGPFAALVFCVYWRRQSWSLGSAVTRGSWWLVPVLVTYASLWPSMWVQPLETLKTVFGTALFYAGNPHTNSNFFMGQPQPDPGALFYPVALAFRLTPWTMVGAAIGALRLVWRRKDRDALLVLAAFVLAYGAFMTMGMKKFDRYLLPVFPFVQVLAACGILWLGNALARVVGKWRAESSGIGGLASGAMAALVLIAVVLGVWPHRPYYLTYYNPLLGGARRAADVLLVGWGEGLDLAGRYLDGLPESGNASMSARSLPAVASFFGGWAKDEGDYDPALSDYVVIYINEVQRRLGEEQLQRYYEATAPAYVASLKGVDYAWVYENQTHVAPMAHVRSRGKPGDAIVVSRESRFSEIYDGALPLHVLPENASREALRAALDAAAQGADRVWYVRYAAQDPDPALEWCDYLLRTRARLLEGQEYTDVSLSLWEAKGVSFLEADTGGSDQRVQFADTLALQSWEVDSQSVQWDRSVGLLLRWQALRDVGEHLAVFVHVVDEQGRRWGQGDRWIMNESLVPTAGWHEGDTATDMLTIDLQPGIAPGRYTLLFGVYDRQTHEYLDLIDGTGANLGWRAALGSIDVAPAATQPALDALPVERRLEQKVADDLVAVGWGIEPSAPAFGEPFFVNMVWACDEGPRDDWKIELRVVDGDGVVQARGVYPLASDTYPTSSWVDGQVLRQDYDLSMSPDALVGMMSLQARLVAESTTEWLQLGQVSVDGHRSAVPREATALDIGLGSIVRLVGYSVDKAVAKPGESLEFTAYWRALSEDRPSYKVFVHLLDAQGVLRGQDDSYPRRNTYPTDVWRAGEVIADRHTIMIDQDAPPGEYSVGVGMYDPLQNNERLSMAGADGSAVPDNRLVLDAVIQIDASGD